MGQGIFVQGPSRAQTVPQHALGMVDHDLYVLVRLVEVGRGDPLLDAPPAAEILEGGRGKDAGPVTGVGLSNAESCELVPDSR